MSFQEYAFLVLKIIVLLLLFSAEKEFVTYAIQLSVLKCEYVYQENCWYCLLLFDQYNSASATQSA